MKTILPVLNNNISHSSLTNYWCRWGALVLLLCSFSLLTSAQNKVWDKTIGGDSDDNLTVMVKTPDGGYLLGGYSTSSESGDKSPGSKGKEDFWFMKVTGTGAKIWDKRFGGTGDDELRASIQTSDGGYVLAGKSFSEKIGNKRQDCQGSSDYWIVKTNRDGMYQWSKTFRGSLAEELRAVIQTSDGGLLLGGRSNSGVSGDRT